MDGQFHSPTVLIRCLGQTSLSDPSTFFRCAQNCCHSLLGSSHQSVVYRICHPNCGQIIFLLHKGWELGLSEGYKARPAESSVCVALLPTSSFTPSPGRPHSPEYSPAATGTLCRDIRGSFKLLPRSSHCCVSGRSLVHLGPGKSRLGQSGNLGQC